MASGRWGERRAWITVVVMLAAIAAWLWPIGLGGRMPVGGDVTQFALGPLSVLSHAMRSGRLPLWNDLWGYGFPGVGESQMGVYYPPHWLLYGLLAPEVAFTTSLVIHTLWGGLGAYYASRRFGASEMGAGLGGFAWATCGFFFIHLPHHWASTTGCWMPWAWALGWSVLRGQGTPRTPFLLAVVLTLQLLPGHFQLAFYTQVGLLILTAQQALEAALLRSKTRGGIFQALAAMGGAFLLAALQLWPTLRLARLAGSRRDFEYLSGFAASPLHLVTFLAPGFFEFSPLWREIVWDPFHTSPEEYLGFIGIVPLFLALGAIGSSWRRSAEVRALTTVVVVTLFLGLGPYVPGFHFLCIVPGFSFFRGPARWFLATSLALCVLAALGFDDLDRWQRPGQAIVRFVGIGLSALILIVLAIELALASSQPPGWGVPEAVYSKVFSVLPWPEAASTYDRIVQRARSPFFDHRVEETWARQGMRLKSAPRPIFVLQRFAIYREELSATGVVFALLLVSPALGRRRLKAGLIVLTFAELWWLGRHRRVDLGPIVSLARQSPVMAWLDRQPDGLRSVDSFKNMPMVVGAAPIRAYRTLDYPALGSLTALANDVPFDQPRIGKDSNLAAVLGAIRATGTGVRIFDPFESQELKSNGARWPDPLERIRDPVLAGWLFGEDWVRQQGSWAKTFQISRISGPVARAWLVLLSPERRESILGNWNGRPEVVLKILKDASPIEVKSADPEHRELSVRCEGPSLVVLSELADPQWRAELLDMKGEKHVAPVERAFGSPNLGAWQAVQLPTRGEWTLRLSYQGRDVLEGLIVSALAWMLLVGLWVRYGRGPAFVEGENAS